MRLLHWLVAAALVVQFAFGWATEHAESRAAGLRMLDLHVQLGTVIFVLMLVRCVVRFASAQPADPVGEPRWRRRLAIGVHAALYLWPFVLSVSGYVSWVWADVPVDLLGLVDVPRLFVPPVDDETWRAIAWYVHYACAWSLLALVVVHVGAACWHAFVERDGLIRRRML